MKYWVYLDGRQQGPYDEEQLKELPLSADTKVWHSGMEKWERISLVPDLEHILREPPKFRTTPPPAPQPKATVVEDSVYVEINAVPSGENPAGQVRRASPRPDRRPRRSTPAYIAWSIALTVLCCSPVSLGALAASIVTAHYDRTENLRSARMWSQITQWLIMASIALGALPVLYFLLIFA